jgi:ATP-dependent DNA ligase
VIQPISLSAHYNGLISFREEGIVVKNPLSKYDFNARGNDWVKFKPEYIDHLSDDLDLVILGICVFGFCEIRHYII